MICDCLSDNFLWWCRKFRRELMQRLGTIPADSTFTHQLIHSSNLWIVEMVIHVVLEDDSVEQRCNRPAKAR